MESTDAYAILDCSVQHLPDVMLVLLGLSEQSFYFQEEPLEVLTSGYHYRRVNHSCTRSDSRRIDSSVHGPPG